jgi:predicted ABC-type exoprotein transport system permease subunit
MNNIKAQWLLGNKNSSTRVKVLRWIARAWSLFALALALLIMLSPDPYAVNPIQPGEVFMLSLWGLAILGLLLAWRWEQLGALSTILIMPIRELVYILIYREWTVNFLLIWALVIPPAVMYLLAWYGDRKQQVVD